MTRDVAQTKENGSEAPPPPPPWGISTVIWAHAKAEDVSPEFLERGPAWYAIFNPDVGRSLDVRLVHTLIHDGPVFCVRFSLDGMYVAVGCNAGAVQIYDIATGARTCILSLDESQGTLYSVCFSPDRNYLVTVGEDKRIRIWNIENKEVQHSFEDHQDEINCLDFSKDGRFILSGSEDDTARVWDWEAGSSTILNTNGSGGTKSAVSSIVISHDGRIIAGGCWDGVIRIWDAQTGQLVERLSGHGGCVKSVIFTPDEKGLISGSNDNKIKHWDLTPFLQCESREDPLPHAASLAPMSTTAIDRAQGAGERGSVCTLTFDGHKDWVRSVAINPHEQWVISGSDDESVLFWDARNAQAQFAIHGHNHWVRSVDVSPAGDIFASGDYNGTVKIWKFEPS